MESKKPLIKFNNGKPVALCNRCFSMMCFVSCPNKDLYEFGDCVVIERRTLGGEELITTPIGKTPPVYCKKCHDFLHNYKLN